MKKELLFILVLLIISNANSQDKIEKGSYQFTTNIIQSSSEMKEKGGTGKVEIFKGSKITVVGISNDLTTVYIKYWNYPVNIKTKNGFFKKKTISSNPRASAFNNKVFELPLESFKKIVQPLYQRYKGTNVGVYTIPFRLRGSGKDFDFESSLSLQANLVAGFGKQTMERSWIDLSLGIGLTGVNLNSNNSNIEEQRTASAFTISSGLVLKPSEFANIGLFIGCDNLGMNDRDVDWVYNGNLWIGLGINISFNTITTNQSPDKRNNK